MIRRNSSGATGSHSRSSQRRWAWYARRRAQSAVEIRVSRGPASWWYTRSTSFTNRVLYRRAMARQTTSSGVWLVPAVTGKGWARMTSVRWNPHFSPRVRYR